jgi:hypothetical protein
LWRAEPGRYCQSSGEQSPVARRLFRGGPQLGIVLDAIVLDGTTLLGAAIALLVFGAIRFLDDVVDLFVSVEEPPEVSDDTGPSNP